MVGAELTELLSGNWVVGAQLTRAPADGVGELPATPWSPLCPPPVLVETVPQGGWASGHGSSFASQ